MGERNNTVLIWYKCIWAPARASSLEKIFDYAGPGCSVFISFTSTGLVLNCHCPKAQEMEMNRSPPHSLTVKYLGALSPIRLLCVLDRAGMTPSSSAGDMLLTAFCMFCHWLLFSSPRVHGYMWSVPLQISKYSQDTLKCSSADRRHIHVCRYVCVCVICMWNMHIEGKGVCTDYRDAAKSLCTCM